MSLAGSHVKSASRNYGNPPAQDLKLGASPVRSDGLATEFTEFTLPIYIYIHYSAASYKITYSIATLSYDNYYVNL